MVLELLRLLAPRLRQQTSRESALALLHHATELGGATEKALFGALAAGDGGLHELLRDNFSQKLPMPTAERGVVYDLWRNSYESEADSGGGVSHRQHGLRMADGTKATRLISDVSSTRGAPSLSHSSSEGVGAARGSGGREASPARSLIRPIETWLRAKWGSGKGWDVSGASR